MTLYFTLFETVCLFVSAFITNFLIPDEAEQLSRGRAAGGYVCHYRCDLRSFTPAPEDASSWGA